MPLSTAATGGCDFATTLLFDPDEHQYLPIAPHASLSNEESESHDDSHSLPKCVFHVRLESRREERADRHE